MSRQHSITIIGSNVRRRDTADTPMTSPRHTVEFIGVSAASRQSVTYFAYRSSIEEVLVRDSRRWMKNSIRNRFILTVAAGSDDDYHRLELNPAAQTPYTYAD